MKAKKILGQNFLVDQNKINEIINSIPNLNESIIIEVGPGKGALTKPLLASAKKVIAIEIDEDMIFVLKNDLNSENFELINKDILDINLSKTLRKYEGQAIQFVSNLPYYISTKIMFKFARNENINSMSIMLQKELVDRIFAKHCSKTYGRLTVAIGSLFNLDKKINVPAGCFIPKPNVDSGFIVLSRRNDINFDIDDYLSFIKDAFSMKRKTLLNSLKKSNFDRLERVKEYLVKNNLNLNIRAEEIPVNDFIKIYHFLI